MISSCVGSLFLFFKHVGPTKASCWSDEAPCTFVGTALDKKDGMAMARWSTVEIDNVMDGEIMRERRWSADDAASRARAPGFVKTWCCENLTALRSNAGIIIRSWMKSWVRNGMGERPYRRQ